MTPMLLQSAIPALASRGIVAIALVYFVIVAAIATWATRRTKNASDFFVAGAGVGLWTKKSLAFFVRRVAQMAIAATMTK